VSRQDWEGDNDGCGGDLLQMERIYMESMAVQAAGTATLMA
jgi:hypothetical protein